jgi:2-polyprenyl-3-methyl-5-hydroxy-6-metoxy-1,4-benzoquinol methylase
VLDAINGPGDVIAELNSFREAFRKQITALANEVLKRNKMNAQSVEAMCARVDAGLRDYASFLTKVNGVRQAQEASTDDRHAQIDLRREWGAATSRTNLFRVELNQWTLMKKLVHEQVVARKKRVPLYQKRRNDVAAAQSAASDAVFDWVHAALNREKQSDDAIERGCFPDIALPNSEFHEHLHAAYRVLLVRAKARPVRFLDVGCGGGLKVLSALRYFSQAEGLDYQKSYVDSASALLERAQVEGASAFKADALTFDGYGDYDVIYFYRPIQDQDKIIEMERRIVDQAAPGTVLIAPYLGFCDRFASLGCGHVAGDVYLSKTSKADAQRWRREAEQTGPAVALAEPDRMPTIWTPLLEASRQSGYDIERYAQPA